MLCDICHKNRATVHLTEMVNDSVVEIHACRQCADLKAHLWEGALDIFGFMGELSDIKETQSKGDLALKCSFCGMLYSEFKKKGRLGCENCYNLFKAELLPLLKKIHGSAQHLGKSPFLKSKEVSWEIKLKDLKERMARAISLEEYEEAARLRDEIEGIKSEYQISKSEIRSTKLETN